MLLRKAEEEEIKPLSVDGEGRPYTVPTKCLVKEQRRFLFLWSPLLEQSSLFFILFNASCTVGMEE